MFHTLQHNVKKFPLLSLLGSFLFLLTLIALYGFYIAKSTPQVESAESKKLKTFELVPGETIYGSSTSPFKVVEYYDLECPYCRSLHQALDQKKDLLQNVGYVYRPFPLPYLHAGADEKGLILLCANEQNKDLLLDGIDYAYRHLDMAPSFFKKYLEGQVKDKESFKNCIQEKSYKEFMEKSITLGRILGVQGTPSLAFYYKNDLVKVVGLVGDRQGVSLIRAFISLPY